MSKRICVPCWRFDCLACEGQGCPCNHWTLEDECATRDSNPEPVD